MLTGKNAVFPSSQIMSFNLLSGRGKSFQLVPDSQNSGKRESKNCPVKPKLLWNKNYTNLDI